jgi:hypothetical protein
MSEIITKDDGSPFATRESAKSRRTRMGAEGLDTNIVTVDGGFVLEKKPYEKPKKRIPLGRRGVLTIDPKDKDPDYSYRIVNDKAGRINMFRDAGWEVVEKRGGLQVGDPQAGVSSQLGAVVTKSVGNGETGYLMRIKKEFYKEDQKVKADKIKAAEEGLKLEQTKKGRYGEIKIGDKKDREY